MKEDELKEPAAPVAAPEGANDIQTHERSEQQNTPAVSPRVPGQADWHEGKDGEKWPDYSRPTTNES